MAVPLGLIYERNEKGRAGICLSFCIALRYPAGGISCLLCESEDTTRTKYSCTCPERRRYDDDLGYEMNSVSKGTQPVTIDPRVLTIWVKAARLLCDI